MRIIIEVDLDGQTAAGGAPTPIVTTVADAIETVDGGVAPSSPDLAPLGPQAEGTAPLAQPPHEVEGIDAGPAPGVPAEAPPIVIEGED
jgi:hypothetical protein